MSFECKYAAPDKLRLTVIVLFPSVAVSAFRMTMNSISKKDCPETRNDKKQLEP